MPSSSRQYSNRTYLRAIRRSSIPYEDDSEANCRTDSLSVSKGSGVRWCHRYYNYAPRRKIGVKFNGRLPQTQTFFTDRQHWCLCYPAAASKCRYCSHARSAVLWTRRLVRQYLSPSVAQGVFLCERTHHHLHTGQILPLYLYIYAKNVRKGSQQTK